MHECRAHPHGKIIFNERQSVRSPAKERRGCRVGRRNVGYRACLIGVGFPYLKRSVQQRIDTGSGRFRRERIDLTEAIESAKHLQVLGIENIADKAGRSGDYPQLSAEYIIASNPDLIVLADTVCCGQTAKTVAARSGWRRLSAVKNGGIVPVDDSIASEWGPRIVLFVKTIAEAVKKLEGNPA